MVIYENEPSSPASGSALAEGARILEAVEPSTPLVDEPKILELVPNRFEDLAKPPA